MIKDRHCVCSLFLLPAAWLPLDGQVAVGDIVKVTNGQHLPADMIILSSRSDDSCFGCYFALHCLANVNFNFALCLALQVIVLK